MAVYTDNPQFAAAFLSPEVAAGLAPIDGRDTDLGSLLSEVFGVTRGLFSVDAPVVALRHLFLSEFSRHSQYDQLIDLARREAGLPDRIALLAGSGFGFHGFKGRSWAAAPGNLHLAVHLAPGRGIDRFEVAFTILAALSVVEGLSQIAGLEVEARIKWVNDILLEDRKVGGVLAYSQSQGQTVTSAVLGIGVNLETTPEVDATPFVPSVGSVRDFLPHAGEDMRAAALESLLRALDSNYQVLLENGVSPLLERYREHSMAIGEEVTVCTDSPDQTLQIIAQGRFAGLGDNLELYLEGKSDPLTGGRLILGRATEEKEDIATGAGETGLAPRVAKKYHS
jgi:biotin-[acetyl-CoA-carboxylase] ligase BirA-like protein